MYAQMYFLLQTYCTTISNITIQIERKKKKTQAQPTTTRKWIKLVRLFRNLQILIVWQKFNIVPTKLELTWIHLPKAFGRHISLYRSSTATGVNKLVDKVTAHRFPFETFRLHGLLNNWSKQCSYCYIVYVCKNSL